MRIQDEIKIVIEEKLDKRTKLLISLIVILGFLVVINITSILGKTVNSSSSEDKFTSILSDSYQTPIQVLKTYNDDKFLYAMYRKDSKYGLTVFEKHKFLHSRFIPSKNIENSNNSKIGYIVINDEKASKVVFFGDLEKSTSSFIDVSYNEKSLRANLDYDDNKRIIKVFTFEKDSSSEAEIKVLDKNNNNLTESLK
ncbi:hypothetical protein CPJCM30710_22290 [Clostridium polyendosporum]|uniref:Uncharacterized protein n=1 Tax=Clostridium polyendosporum TaxID=69208 RepID=A0A919S1J2_9CLOT|nr:hypothetical protein [Clostridium polyendosporum]GIM29563.1 hypothetical protein CPJCM30710_22290 [Clostridium polyendosporum]